MSICIGMTVSDRPHYLEETLSYWRNVRGVEDVPFFFLVEPTSRRPEVLQVLDDLPDWNVKIVLNRRRRGVLGNPYFAMGFMLQEYDYAILVEEDVWVSSDILEYHQWASEKYESNHQVAAVCSFSVDDGPVDKVVMRPTFSPLIWGTWRDRWNGIIGPTWDHDYSSGDYDWDNGWDHNLVRRVIPNRNMLCVFPSFSRSQHAGVQGVHCTPEIFAQTKTDYWRPEIPPVTFDS